MIEIIKKEDIIKGNNLMVDEHLLYEHIVIEPSYHFDEIKYVKSGDKPISFNVIEKFISLVIPSKDLDDITIEYTDKQIEREDKLNQLLIKE